MDELKEAIDIIAGRTPVPPNREMMRLRDMLDERGIDYQMHDGGNRVCFYFDYCEQCGDYLKSIDVIGNCVIASQSYLTPEQAIAATVGGYAITFAPTLDRPPETMVGETVFDSEGVAVGWIVNARIEEVTE